MKELTFTLITTLVMACTGGGDSSDLTSKLPSVGEPLELVVETFQADQSLATSNMVVGSGNQGVVKLGLADGQKIAITIATLQENGGVRVGGAFTEDQAAEVVPTYVLRPGETVEIAGDGMFAEFAAHITLAPNFNQYDIKKYPLCSCDCGGSSTFCCACSDYCNACCGGASCQIP